MRKFLLFGLALAMHGGSVSAGIYKCVDSQGRVTYTNDVDTAKGCKQLDEDLPVSSVPSLKPPARSAPKVPDSSEQNFPRVSPDEQQSRDDSRRSILGTELAAEQQALAEAERHWRSRIRSASATSAIIRRSWIVSSLSSSRSNSIAAMSRP